VFSAAIKSSHFVSPLFSIRTSPNTLTVGALASCGGSLVEDPLLPNQLISTPAYRFALSHYGQAVKKMRASLGAISSTSTSGASGAHLRKALVGCLLVICFESLQGNFTQALTHAVSGTQLLQSWLSDQQKSEQGGSKEGIVSPNHHLIEDSLVQAFGRLDLQVMAYVDPRPASSHELLMREGEMTVLHMPSVFKDVDEARLYLEVIQRRSSHFIASTAAKSLRTGRYVPTTSVDVGIGEPMLRFHPESELHTGEEVEMPVEHRRYAGEFARWFSAFAPFYSSLEKSTDERTYIAASLLSIHAKTSEIMLLSNLFGDESSLDRFLPQYREVVSLAGEISHGKWIVNGKFKFDLGIVNPLRLVAKW
jgi:hypothetical protein